MFDTNIYDLIFDKGINLNLIKNKGQFYITNVQLSEIKNIANESRKTKLLKIIEDLNQIQVNLESGIWLDDLFWDDNQIWIDNISDSCQTLLGNAINSHRWKDALIGEVAKRHSLTLITNDNRFKQRAELSKIETISFNEFLILS